MKTKSLSVDSSIIESSKKYVKTIFGKFHDKSILQYHDLYHTKSVVKAAKRIAEHYKLSDDDYTILITAAWFHDIGYFDDPFHHEEKGALNVERFLTVKQVDPVSIARVKNCILATRLPQQPHDLLEQILCDADLFHFGTKEFKDRSKLMRKEYQILYKKKISKEAWWSKSLALLSGHTFHTTYAQVQLQAGKARNIAWLRTKLKH
jgi:predicted metal-dependent HD superfamily phosphohydrolase